MSRPTTSPVRSLTVALGLAAAAALALAPSSASAQTALTGPASYPGPYAQSAPILVDWDVNQPIPSGYHVQKRIRLPFVIAGAALLGASYLPTFIGGIAGAAQGSRMAAAGVVPVFGPFIWAGQLHGSSQWADTFLIADGIAQIAGAAAIITGIALPRHVLVRDDMAKVHIVPTPLSFGRSGGGIGLTGTF